MYRPNIASSLTEDVVLECEGFKRLIAFSFGNLLWVFIEFVEINSCNL